VRRLTLTLKTWPVVAAITIGLCYLTQLAAGWVGVALPEQSNVMLIREWAGWNLRFIINLALILAVLPIVEELIFRGALFVLPRRFLPRLGLVWAVVSAALFSAAHYLAQPFPDNAFIALAFFGIAQCWLYRRTERLWCPMLNHSLFNLTNLVLLFIVPEQGGLS